MSGMNCQEFEATILSMARMQLLEASARRQTLVHIAQCPACADWLAEQQALTAAIRSTAKSLRDENASTKVEHSLRAAFRTQAGVNSKNHFSKPAWQWPRQTLLAAAAILLLFLLTGTIRQWLLADQTPKTTFTLPPPTHKESELSLGRSLPSAQHEIATESLLAVESRRKRSGIRPKPATSQDDAEFIVLTNETELVPLESGQVLRVELPTSALISMGLRITTEDLSKPVLADLLVGQDGLPRAIRFVRSSGTETGEPQEHSTNK